jgi:hypothetical protein
MNPFSAVARAFSIAAAAVMTMSMLAATAAISGMEEEAAATRVGQIAAPKPPMLVAAGWPIPK